MSYPASPCQCRRLSSGNKPLVYCFGQFFRTSDRVLVPRFRCRGCGKTFSLATHDLRFRQKKRQVNEPLASLLVSGVSQRRASLLFRINRKTVVRKFLFVGELAKKQLVSSQLARPSRAAAVEFDDLETAEHTKLKPLSVTIALECKSRRILGFRVAQMPAKGLLAAASRKKYGTRKDLRPQARNSLFAEIKPLIDPLALIKSDENPHYQKDLERYFPSARFQLHKGRKATIAGLGELKRGGFDPLFSINHTCASLRANINRLFRRTWCTTKKSDRLALHIALYAVFHNGQPKVIKAYQRLHQN